MAYRANDSTSIQCSGSREAAQFQSGAQPVNPSPLVPFSWISCAVYPLFQGNEMPHAEPVLRKSCQVREGDVYWGTC